MDIESILKKQGRAKDSVKIIAVTKTIDIERIQKAINLGVTDIGENRVQELEKKMDFFGEDVNYHMIGHLQTNKVKYIIDRVKLIHSLDRISLAKEMDKQAKKKDIIIQSLVQVNVAEEESKFGLPVEKVIPFIEEIAKFSNIHIKGLMTIAPYVTDEQLLRDIFRQMYNLQEDIKSMNYDHVSLEYLSMGMTNDYRIAIEEGSNMVRIGTGIFGKRDYKEGF